jgi:hypothetical protein
MTSQTVTLLAGILLLFITIAGGGFTVKKIQMRKIPTWERCVAAILGLALIAVSAWGTFKPPSRLAGGDSSSQEYACKHPKDLPAVTEDDRSEAEIRNFLTSEGFLNVVTEPTFVPGAPQGAVVGQEPSPGTILCPRDPMIIKIAQ